MAKNKKLSKTILELSEGIFSTAIDLVLWLTLFSSEMFIPQSPYGAAYRASYKADRQLEKLNYETIKRAFAQARHKGLVKSALRKKGVNSEITKSGRKRLQSILPFYDKKRVWDSTLYLITYDIPEKQRDDRKLLREYLKKIGCGILQQSVWITPYNPRDTLKNFIWEKHLKGAVIISDIGKDGSIGEEDINFLVARVYKLDDINNRYQKFLEQYQDQKNIIPDKIAFSFVSILKDDPQLPFLLLPYDWLGNKAYSFFIEKTGCNFI